MTQNDSESTTVFRAGWPELAPRLFATFAVAAGAGVIIVGCVMSFIQDGIEWGLGFALVAAFMVYLALFVLRATLALARWRVTIGPADIKMTLPRIMLGGEGKRGGMTRLTLSGDDLDAVLTRLEATQGLLRMTTIERVYALRLKDQRTIRFAVDSSLTDPWPRDTRASRAAEAIARFSRIPVTDPGMVKRRAFAFRRSVMPDWNTPGLCAVEQGQLWRAASNTRSISNSMAAGSSAIDS